MAAPDIKLETVFIITVPQTTLRQVRQKWITIDAFVIMSIYLCQKWVVVM